MQPLNDTRQGVSLIFIFFEKEATWILPIPSGSISWRAAQRATQLLLPGFLARLPFHALTFATQTLSEDPMDMPELVKDPRQGSLEPTITLVQSTQADLGRSSQDWVSMAGKEGT